MIKLNEKSYTNENSDLEFNYKENRSNIKISFERVASPLVKASSTVSKTCS